VWRLRWRGKRLLTGSGLHVYRVALRSGLGGWQLRYQPLRYDVSSDSGLASKRIHPSARDKSASRKCGGQAVSEWVAADARCSLASINMRGGGQPRVNRADEREGAVRGARRPRQPQRTTSTRARDQPQRRTPCEYHSKDSHKHSSGCSTSRTALPRVKGLDCVFVRVNELAGH
jgi:hypothetical protein